MQSGIFIVETGCKEKPQTISDNPQTIPLNGNFEFIRNYQIFICPTRKDSYLRCKNPHPPLWIQNHVLVYNKSHLISLFNHCLMHCMRIYLFYIYKFSSVTSTHELAISSLLFISYLTRTLLWRVSCSVLF